MATNCNAAMMIDKSNSKSMVIIDIIAKTDRGEEGGEEEGGVWWPHGGQSLPTALPSLCSHDRCMTSSK